MADRQQNSGRLLAMRGHNVPEPVPKAFTGPKYTSLICDFNLYEGQISCRVGPGRGDLEKHRTKMLSWRVTDQAEAEEKVRALALVAEAVGADIYIGRNAAGLELDEFRYDFEPEAVRAFIENARATILVLVSNFEHVDEEADGQWVAVVKSRGVQTADLLNEILVGTGAQVGSIR